MLNQSQMTRLREAAAEIDFLASDFSWRDLRESAYRAANLMEANAESTFGYLLRSGVQEFANEVYSDLPVIYPNFVTEVNSNRRAELYSGLYRPALPRPVDAGEKFQDTAFKGFQREIINRKFGHIETFERELFDDDQTGQIKARAGNLGEGFRIFEEIYTLRRLFGLAGTEEGVEVPASTYNSGTPFTTAIGNRPTSFGLLSQTNLEAAHVAMRKMTDPLGRKFLVTPTILIVSPDDELLAYTLLNSQFYAFNAAGATSNMVNPLMGRYTPYASPFLPARAWMIGDPKRGFVFQRRDAMEITQENVQSGHSFIQEVYAFRARERFECDWVESRFAFLGNDGSVTS
jgi:hypothetical protein